jgi:hypothetical protein
MQGAWMFTWTAIPNGNQGATAPCASYSDRTVQITGTFGAAGSINIEGSNDGSNWFILRDPAGAALTFTSANLKQILEDTRYLRPNVTAGDGTTALTVIVVATSVARG